MSGFNVAPRYTPGSPALVDEATALKVAREEKDAYEYVLKGYGGVADQRKAQAPKAQAPNALALIVFEMRERPKGWVVHDMITDEWHWWPFLGACPSCGQTKLRLERGFVTMHPYKGGVGICNSRQYVGKQLHDENRNFKFKG